MSKFRKKIEWLNKECFFDGALQVIGYHPNYYTPDKFHYDFYIAGYLLDTLVVPFLKEQDFYQKIEDKIKEVIKANQDKIKEIIKELRFERRIAGPLDKEQIEKIICKVKTYLNHA